ncbi:glycosyltransferase family 9 protein [Dyadobacter sediminis]|uniref:Glycosyltransferase family 9 protein n=1 Tax=Dyadobacter sediminis TaxID=1493691 RepID=A0A5R9KL39_9BACT|nr:glycosyltransferase family 9 protein [Dyadobacter sediminis]TLU96849.1 glycosyltransferase family 9 protein [Dyadobacter sediminis]GGB85631.1 heptosyltransferase [Dyadobacter sediminis]
MKLERFIQLWTHRYHKYSHILKANLFGYRSGLHFKTVKSKLKQGQKLVAVIRTEHFGDIVAAEPISRYVRSLYPDAYMVWFVKPAFNELVGFNPAIDEVLQEFCVTQREVLLKTGVFDEVFQLQFKNNNHCPKCQVYVENPVAEQRDINIYNYFDYGNLLEVFAQSGGLIPAKTAFPADDQPRLYLQKKHTEKVDSLHLDKKFIVIHCQSNYAPKDWPAKQWEKLVQWLADQYDYEIVEIGLKSNLEIKAGAYRNLCGQLSILETAEVIRRASFFIGLDSGPSHLGNATGTFGIVLMGSLNNFPQYNPYSGSYGRQENAFFVRQEGMPCSALSFEFVREKVASVLNSRKVEKQN